MHAYTFNLGRYSVQEETFIGIKGESSDTQRSGVFIFQFIFHKKPGNHAVQIRIFKCPTYRIVQIQLLAGYVGLSGFKFQHGLNLCDFLSRSIFDDCDDFYIRRAVIIVFDCCYDIYRCFFTTYFGCGDIRSPQIHVYRIGDCEPDIAVYSTARIPAGVGLFAVIHPNSNHVISIKF